MRQLHAHLIDTSVNHGQTKTNGISQAGVHVNFEVGIQILPKILSKVNMRPSIAQLKTVADQHTLLIWHSIHHSVSPETPAQPTHKISPILKSQLVSICGLRALS